MKERYIKGQNIDTVTAKQTLESADYKALMASRESIDKSHITT